jgi:neutral ceramidase
MRTLALLVLVVLSGCASAPKPAAPPPPPVRPIAPPSKVEPTMRAGASKVKITPEKFGWMTGYGNRTKPADGVKQDLYVRSFLIEDAAGKQAVIVSADILGFPPRMCETMRRLAREKFGLPESAMMFVATHTHGGPAVPQRPSMEIFHGLDENTGREVFEYAAWLQERVLESIGAALHARKAAKITFTKSKATFGVNRRFRNKDGTYSIKDNPDGTVDPEVTIVKAETLEGAPIATVFTYACHCTALGGDIYQYHGDWSGIACDELEKATGVPAVFATGCGADINPSPRGKFEHAEQHGKAMAKAVLEAPAGEPLTGPIRTKLRVIDLPLDKLPGWDFLKVLDADTEKNKNVFRQRHTKVIFRQYRSDTLPGEVPFPIQAWHLGEHVLVALGGETCVQYALRLKKDLGPSGKVWVVGYANGVMCYIPSEKVLTEGGYEAGWDPATGRAIASGSMMYYGWAVPFAEDIENRIILATLKLVNE